ncbi:MAG TPA: beta-ketoacyl synthase chain length factor [Puia sp.]|nr:beta-ketoacyl synthase chain length factor [Puia sp.]
MTIYIRSMATISPCAAPGDHPSQTEPVNPSGNRLRAIEPDYTAFIDAKQIRRMSRIVRMGVAAAVRCLREADEPMPGAIVTGTAYGCLEDTGIFLDRLIRQKEEMLSPTSFIQSTHNTIGAQIALMLQCTHYNNTFVHRGFSFESALLDAILLLEEGSAETVLVGGVDETTEASHAILERFGLYRRAVAGEGAAFFLLSNRSSGKDRGQLEGLHTFYRPASVAVIEDTIRCFLADRSMTMEEVGLVLMGTDGGLAADETDSPLKEGIFRGKECVGFKKLCGDYPTASSFALGLAAGMLAEEKTPKRILIYTHYLNIYHSLMLVSTC